MNYHGKPRCVMILAHELGHGVHQALARKQGALLSRTPLTIAETASVFGEMLTFKEMLRRETDPKARQALIAKKVEDMLATVVRQISFFEFEKKVHAARKQGELTAEQMGGMWTDSLKDSLGPAFRFDEAVKSAWAGIPHFVHTPYYVYAYAFGDCLVNALYKTYETAPQGFTDKYLALLESGGSKHHTELLSPFGLSAADPDFWKTGLAVISDLIDELEAGPALDLAPKSKSAKQAKDKRPPAPPPGG
jgi:oligoendopeptidase F